MRLIFIRHGDPNYDLDTLTEKGWREAALLSERVSKWHVDDFYCSPLGRAKDTASLSLKKMGREAEECPWLREFNAPIISPVDQKRHIPWDFMPDYWTNIEMMYDRESFADTEVMRTGPVKEEYARIRRELDALLKRYGYVRDERVYRVGKPQEGKHKDDTVVCFCHMGVTIFLMGHLLGISPLVLAQGFFLAPTSVTVLATEERIPGTAYFRCQAAGDTRHLYEGGEPVSHMGYFTEPFQG